MDKRLSMRLLGKRINEHLKRFEREEDEKIGGSTRGSYYNAGAGANGRYINVCYISYQGSTNLTRTDAERYLAWLDSGKVGRHFEAFREGK